MSVPFQVVIGFPAGHHNRKFAYVRIQCSRHCRVVKIKQSLGDSRVVRGESQRSAQYTFLAESGQYIENLLAGIVQTLPLQVREASPRIRIDIRG
jgi:hypothetical protein